jgi:hypothetical protein
MRILAAVLLSGAITLAAAGQNEISAGSPSHQELKTLEPAATAPPLRRLQHEA